LEKGSEGGQEVKGVKNLKSLLHESEEGKGGRESKNSFFMGDFPRGINLMDPSS